MSVREVSIEAYERVVSSGLLGRRQREVWIALDRSGPSTGNELYRSMGLDRELNQQNIVTRLGELRDQGVVREVRQRVCRVTRFTATEWETVPERPRPKPQKQLGAKTRRIRELEAKVKEMGARIYELEDLVLKSRANKKSGQVDFF